MSALQSCFQRKIDFFHLKKKSYEHEKHSNTSFDIFCHNIYIQRFDNSYHNLQKSVWFSDEKGLEKYFLELVVSVYIHIYNHSISNVF